MARRGWLGVWISRSSSLVEASDIYMRMNSWAHGELLVKFTHARPTDRQTAG